MYENEKLEYVGIIITKERLACISDEILLLLGIGGVGKLKIAIKDDDFVIIPCHDPIIIRCK